jgi:SAM-dependent methyltransferase
MLLHGRSGGGERIMKAVATHCDECQPADSASPSAVWASIAKSYSAFGSPFVPSREDVVAYEAAIHAELSPDQARGDALILGVTPALATMNWPEQMPVVGLEISREVINSIWPGDIHGARRSVCGSWFDPPFGQNSFEVVVGDGSLSTCRFPGSVSKLLYSIRKLLKSNGLLIIRTYVRPAVVESVPQLMERLFTQGLSVDCFKMGLYIAMQRTPYEGVAVKDAARIMD